MDNLFLFQTCAKLDIEDVIHAMSDLADEDFNGNNGDEFTSEEALENGFESDRDYVVDTLLKKYKDEEPNENILSNIIYEYCNECFSDTNYYSDYKVEYTIVDDKIIIAVAYTEE